MKRLERRLGKSTISDGNAGLGTAFTAIANNMVAYGGRIALILPTSAMMGGSHDAEKGQAYSWQRLRNLLHDYYNDIIVVSIAQPDKKSSAFSADSDFADCIVIARRIPTGAAPSRRAHFVNLEAVPSTKLEAQETARAIKTAIANATELDTWNRIQVGEEEVGFVHYERDSPQPQVDHGSRFQSNVSCTGQKSCSGQAASAPARRSQSNFPLQRWGTSRRLALWTETLLAEATAHSTNATSTSQHTNTRCYGTMTKRDKACKVSMLT